MTFVAEHLLESTLTVAVGLLAVAILRGRSAATRHAILAASLVLVPILPITAAVAPAWNMPVLDTWLASDAAGTSTLRWLQEAPAPVPAARASAPAAAVTTTAGFTPAALLGGIWLAGVVTGLLHLAVGLRRLSALAAASAPVDIPAWTSAARDIRERFGIGRPIDLRQSGHQTLLVTWGLWRPRVVVPATAMDWPVDRIHSVLGHELAHVRRGDWAVQMAVELVRTAYWFHPLVWIACRRLRDESEHACDDAVIDSGVAAQEYATHLFEVARTFAGHPDRWLPAAAIARPSTLERRIAAMLSADPNRRPARRWATAAAIVMMGSVAVISAGFDPASLVEGPVPSSVDGPGAAPRTSASADVTLAATPVMPAAVMSPAAAGPVPSAPALTATPPAATPVDATAPVEAAPATAAQDGEAVVFGRIVDPSGAVLPGVEVVLRRSTETEGRRTVSDGSGYYEVAGVAAGDAIITMRLPGFRTGSAAVVVPPFGSVEFSTSLGIGALVETITVTGQRSNPFAPQRQRQVSATTPVQPPLPRLSMPARVSPEPGQPVRVGGAIKVPRKLVDVRPVYPAAAQANGLEGVVILEATIGADGATHDIKVLRALEPDLNDAATDAVKGWKFTPTLLNNVAVPVIMTVNVQFRLD